ncbi:Helix-turn-helix domain-containing protein [Plantibacter flavus]|uniref:Helix-turn-helix protein n=1 Tax=Plantibacter flavus TaxID=150123 RepID=A0A3N2C0T7_9MICO|nr:helix-turn-helix domain-containing protein [Plantibacter flavus]ROR81103.1 helix-turn-helix protein [Plantibacter flavus]SMG07920.1 Helix-turn-helix domain-containing protein [Plantibacter flavus]
MITGEQLRLARKAAQLSQGALAEIVGVSLRTIGNWERTEVVPPKHWPDLRAVFPAIDSPHQVPVEPRVEQAPDESEHTLIELSIGDRVRKYRKLEGMSKSELSEETGIPVTVIDRIEAGKRHDLRVQELLSISAAVRVPPAAIMFDVDRPFSGVEVGDPSVTGRVLPTRVIDLVDWLSGQSSDEDEELVDFERDLQEHGPLLIQPVGMVIEATYGPAGERAVRLIKLAKEIDRVAALRDHFRYTILRSANQVWPFREERGHRDTLNEALAANKLLGSEVAEELVAAVGDEGADLQTDMHRYAELTTELDHLHAALEGLGGSPRSSLGAMGRRDMMLFAERIATIRLQDYLRDAPEDPDQPEREKYRKAALARIERELRLFQSIEGDVSRLRERDVAPRDETAEAEGLEPWLQTMNLGVSGAPQDEDFEVDDVTQVELDLVAKQGTRNIEQADEPLRSSADPLGA